MKLKTKLCDNSTTFLSIKIKMFIFCFNFETKYLLFVFEKKTQGIRLFYNFDLIMIP